MTQHLDLRALDAASPLSPATAVNLDSLEKYVLYWARNPHPKSFFAKFTRFIRWLPDEIYVWALKRKRYGGHILYMDGVPIGHIFYQEHHGHEVHMFSVEVEERYRKLGFGNQLMRSFLLEMGQRKHIDVLRISAGGDEKVRHMWLKTLRGGYDLPYTVERWHPPGDGWVHIVR